MSKLSPAMSRLITDLYFLISTVIAQSFNPIAGCAIPLGIETGGAKTETETHPVIAETKISNS